MRLWGNLDIVETAGTFYMLHGKMQENTLVENLEKSGCLH